MARRAGRRQIPALWRHDGLVRALVRSPTVRRAVCPGSFDPVTCGHLDVIERVSPLFDEIIVVVGFTVSKSGLCEREERVEMIREVTADLPNVRVDVFKGLLAGFCKANGVQAIVKGLRAVSDFGYGQEMGQMNHSLAGVETLFIPTNPLYSFLWSSLVKEVATYGGDVSGLVPDVVLRRLQSRLAR